MRRQTVDHPRTSTYRVYADILQFGTKFLYEHQNLEFNSIGRANGKLQQTEFWSTFHCLYNIHPVLQEREVLQWNLLA